MKRLIVAASCVMGMAACGSPQPRREVVVVERERRPPPPRREVVEVIVREPPPAVRPEPPRPPQPSPRHVWIAGSWHWEGDREHGRWDWIGGHWDVAEVDGAVWVEPHYDRAANGEIRYTRGHWQGPERPQ